MNKEQIYDEKINPLMTQVIEICKANSIAMLATFDIPNDEDPDLACTTHLPDETGKLPDRIADCARAAKAGRTSASPLMITTQHADGSKTLTAVLG